MATFVLFSNASRADTVWLDGGDRVSGQIETIDGGNLRIETSWGGVLIIDREAVVAVETDDTLNLKVDDEPLVIGRLVRGSSGEQALESEGVTREIGFGELESASHDIEEDGPVLGWTANVTYGLNLARGNSETATHNVRAQAGLREETRRHNLKFELDREEDEGTVTKDQLRTSYKLDWFFREDWYSYGNVEYFTDDLKDLEYRVTVGAGVGHQFWETSLGALSVEGGASAVTEKIGDEDTTNPAARWYLNYNRFLYGKRLEAFHNHEIVAPFDTDRGQFLQSATGLRFALNGRISTNLQVDFDYETEPAADRKKWDVTYLLGVGVKLN